MLCHIISIYPPGVYVQHCFAVCKSAPSRRKSYTFLHVVRFNPTNMQQSVRLSERKAKGRPVDTERPYQHESFTPLHPLRLDGGDRHRVNDVLNGGAA